MSKNIDKRVWGVLGKQQTYFSPQKQVEGKTKTPLNANSFDSWDSKRSKFKRVDGYENAIQQGGAVPQVSSTPVVSTPTPTPSITPTITLTPSITPTITFTPTPSITPTITLTPSTSPVANNCVWDTASITWNTNNNTWNSCSPFTFDADAAAYLTAVVDAGGTGITNTVSAATNTLFVELKNNSLYNKLTAMYPLLGGVVSSCKFNAKNPVDTDGAYRLSFNGGWTFGTNGATGNNSNTYARTFLTGSTLDRYSQHLSYYVGTETLSNSCYEMGAQTGGVVYTDLNVDFIAFGGNYRGGNINATGSMFNDTPANANMAGYYIVSRTSDTTSYMTRNGNQIFSSTTTTNGTIPYDIYLGARNDDGFPNYYNDRRMGFASIGSGLTPSEMVILTSLVNEWADRLNRNTY